MDIVKLGSPSALISSPRLFLIVACAFKKQLLAIIC
jgi:hypothetical protein